MQPRSKRYLALVCFAVVGIGAAVLAAQSSLADFGVTEARLKSGLVNAFVDGNLPLYPSRKAYYAATPAVRVAFVKSALGWVKGYTESAAFKADYDKRRAEAKPSAPASKGAPDEQYAKALAEQRKSIEELKANIAKMPLDMQKQMQQVVKQMEESMAKTGKDQQTANIMKQSYAQQAAEDQKRYQQSLTDYDEKYPADVKVLIARRLRSFLDETKDINFDAALVKSGGTMRFADSRYESKPDQWKLYYRAGREPVNAARTFASEWLKQLSTK